MEENLTPLPQPEPEHKLTARGREFIFGGVIALLSILMCHFVFFGGFHLAFGLTAAAMIAASWLYLRKSGKPFGGYEKSLLILSMLISLGFGRSGDGSVKLVMLLFLFAAVNLALCIGAGQNRRDPNGAASLLDAPRAFFRLGMGNMGPANKGMTEGFRRGSRTTRRIGAVGTGLLISLPIMLVMILLLMSADAAFEGLLDLLPEIELSEFVHSLFWGTLLGWILYSRGISLAREDGAAPARSRAKGANALTVNTVLIMVSLVYVVYLFSQLAYFAGGLSGILPEEYTLAQYARRGFFEMAWLCAINLGILCMTIWLIREETLPRLTKIAGTFLAGITIFLILTASAKMFLYIGSYGLTWSRVITEVCMLWLAITTILITLRFFRPGFGYMKAVVLTAMILGTLVFWVDVNSLVANYNVNAYRSGKLETVDVGYLSSLGSAAVPRLLNLSQDSDPEIAEAARYQLSRKNSYTVEDMRQWNFSRATADRLLREYQAGEDAAIREEVSQLLDLDISTGTIQRNQYNPPIWQNGKRMVRVEFDVEDREAFRQQLEEAGWEALPISYRLQAAMNQDTALFAEFREVYLHSSEKEGYWLLLDLHPSAKDHSDPGELLLREEYDFVLAFYNRNANVLYIFQVDKPAKSG